MPTAGKLNVYFDWGKAVHDAFWKASPQRLGRRSFSVILYLHKSNNTILLPPRTFGLGHEDNPREIEINACANFWRYYGISGEFS